MSQSVPLSPDEVKRKLRIILDQGFVTYTDHCRWQSMPEGRVTTQDVEFLLEHGEISGDAEWSPEHGDWKYRIEGTDIEGEEWTAITVIIEEHLIARVITVF